MRAIVCGGRNYRDEHHVASVLHQYGVVELATGGANGADALAEIYAIEMNMPHNVYRADWHTHGKAAGPIRNQRMLDEFKPDAVIAFPGGRGTADMIRRAKAAGVRVIEPTPTPEPRREP